MAVKVTGQCFSCGYPIIANVGEQISCPMCGEINQANNINITRLVIVGLFSFAAGVILGPSIRSKIK